MALRDLLGTGSAAALKQAAASLLKANPQLKNMASVPVGTVINVPDLPHPANPAELTRPPVIPLSKPGALALDRLDGLRQMLASISADYTNDANATIALVRKPEVQAAAGQNPALAQLPPQITWEADGSAGSPNRAEPMRSSHRPDAAGIVKIRELTKPRVYEAAFQRGDAIRAVLMASTIVAAPDDYDSGGGIDFGDSRGLEQAPHSRTLPLLSRKSSMQSAKRFGPLEATALTPPGAVFPVLAQSLRPRVASAIRRPAWRAQILC